MITRLLYKEFRPLSLYLLAAPAAALLVYWSGSGAMAALGLAILLAAVQAFGYEHAHHCVGWLFAQPISKRQLWLVKGTTLSAFVVGLLALTLVLGTAAEWGRWHTRDVSQEDLIEADPNLPSPPLGQHRNPPILTKPFDYRTAMQSISGKWRGSIFAYGSVWVSRLTGYKNQLRFEIDKTTHAVHVSSYAPDYIVILQRDALLPFLLCAVGILGGGFFMGLAMRQSHLAFWAALVVPMIISLIWQMVHPLFFKELFHINHWGDYHGDKIDLVFTLWALPFLAWGLFAIIASWVHIKRLEV